MIPTRPPLATGALVGWKRVGTATGVVVTMQLAGSSSDFRDGEWDTVRMSLNDRQLRSFARDLARAAEARGIDLFGKPPLWKFWLHRGSTDRNRRNDDD